MTMVSDSVMNSAMPNASKDFGKKRRANRSAKLKQCKLDARREQWLSRVKNKGCKEGANGGGGEPHAMRNKIVYCFEDLGIRRSTDEENDGMLHQEIYSKSPANSPNIGGKDSGNDFAGSSGSSSSSSSSHFSSGGSCSGSITEEEEENIDDDDGCVEDWEAIADSLAAVSDEKQTQNPSTDSSVCEDNIVHSDSLTELANGLHVANGEENPKSEYVGIVANNQAWRCDDALRPQCLPHLLKQCNFSMNLKKQCGHGVHPWGFSNAVSVPKLCPICCEDLDFTDSSFLPVRVGFMLCLFCHKRILEEDGRCPGCRKPYDSNPVENETIVCEGSLMIRLVRSCSMFSRT
ncbi:hypothetical protein Nepgr_023294 [Nepenthes gracilis]|uniref:RING-type domain-containing protein n=1 Tax=Nepenthes gracilis TaxID=150966 RepID=A0AAD3T3J1_NEPGR|nr:hypothetical protein Nepgr_023294 [Nepenthes gracilis]